MPSRTRPLLLATLAAALIASGCGDDDDGGGGGSGGGNGDTATDTASDFPKNVAAAVEDCKATVDAAPQLPDEVRSELEADCEAAGEDGEAAVREATEEACLRIVGETLPAGPARDTALEACG